MTSPIRGLGCFVQPPVMWRLPGRPTSPEIAVSSTLPESLRHSKSYYPQDNVWDFTAKSLGFQTVAGPSIPASDFQQALRSVARGEGKKWWGTEKRRQVYITITPSHFSLTDKKTKRIDFIEDLSEIPQLQVSKEDSSIFGFIRFNKEWGSMQLSVFRIAESHTSGYSVEAAYIKACTLKGSPARLRDVAGTDPETLEVPSGCTDQPPIRQSLLRRLWSKMKVQKVRKTPKQPLKKAKENVDSVARRSNQSIDDTTAPSGNRDTVRPPSPPHPLTQERSLGQPLHLSDERMVDDLILLSACESDEEDDYRWQRRKYELRKMRSKRSCMCYDAGRSRTKLGTCAPLPAYLSNTAPFAAVRLQPITIPVHTAPQHPCPPPLGPKPLPPPLLLLTPSSLLSLPTPSFSAVSKLA